MRLMKFSYLRGCQTREGVAIIAISIVTSIAAAGA